jgi:glucose-6-phosphate-specific signal transduction histidine kinase
MVEGIITVVKAMIIAVSIAFGISVLIDIVLVGSYSQISTLGRFVFVIDFLWTLGYIAVLLGVIMGAIYLVCSRQLRRISI